MSTLDQVRAAIVAKLESVDGIGRVHDRERFAKDNSALRGFYEFQGKVLGWNVRRIAKVEKITSLQRYVQLNTWRISGYQSFSDAESSETAFDMLLESIATAFRIDETLAGVISSTTPESGETGIQVEDSGPVMLAGVLCHSARLRLTTIHYL